MKKSLLRTDEDISAIYYRHVDMLYRVCFAYMKNVPDTEEVVQDTFIKLLQAAPIFETQEHEKAWLLRVATNLCKNSLKHWWRKRENLEDYQAATKESGIEVDEIFQLVMALPDKYKSVVYLYYYEGYNSVEIAQMLEKPESTIRTYLKKAREKLKEELEADL